MSVISPCPVMTALAVVGGKWKPVILWVLREEALRFGEIKRRIPPISQKVLTQTLRELERDDIVERHIYPEIPPRVDYTLTAYGRTLRPVLDAIAGWGEGHQRVLAAQPD
ncbi:helix-turn-helix domain-containing protein [Geothrix sp. PMB-07]|uniref:winged helix-turn-helix transcriptional regulator n=1 Tax=Geothrix sp. PMB-07 TaxID=3068640 RepID=UPI0027404909|nr:helix-turn-helix domain-containing protein [Geothrix sp. PMB-07]WLT30107.1 helix-turn-helix domain-containing protein [Geothrix sp. PMB-07]